MCCGGVDSMYGGGWIKQTVQIPITHLITHIPNKQRLARRIAPPPPHPPLPPTTTTRVRPRPRLPAHMKLHRHAPPLENLLVQLPDRLIRRFLRGELHVPEPLTQPAAVGYNAGIGDLAEFRELGFELRGGDFEEEVADVEDAAWLGGGVAAAGAGGGIAGGGLTRRELGGAAATALVGGGGGVEGIAGSAAGGAGGLGGFGDEVLRGFGEACGFGGLRCWGWGFGVAEGFGGGAGGFGDGVVGCWG